MSDDILRRYEIAGRVLAETERRLDEGLTPIVEKKEEAIPNQNIRRFRTLLEELATLPASTNANTVPENLRKVTSIVRVLSDLTYKLESKYYSYDARDEELEEIVQKASIETFGKALERLAAAWKDFNPTVVEPSKEEPVATAVPMAPEVVVQDPLQNAVSQIMQIIKQESIVTSPNGDKYLLEAINGKDVRVKNTFNGKKFTVKVDIIEKWIK